MAFSFLVVGSSVAQDQPNLPAPNPLFRAELKTLAERILKRADKAKCHPQSCTVLVLNFTASSGSTSRLGIELADSISAELLSQGNGIQIVDRNRLRDYLVRERIPSGFLKDREAARWLAGELQANAVLIGKIERQDDHFNVLVELLNSSTDKNGPQEAAQLSLPDPSGGLAPFEPYSTERPRMVVTPAEPSTPLPLGVTGTGVPTCVYCPPPQYTKQGRSAKFQGTVVLLVSITKEGRASEIAVTKGIPFGLNDQAFKSVSQWTFRPAGKGDQPVPALVPIEVSFRLY